MLHQASRRCLRHISLFAPVLLLACADTPQRTEVDCLDNSPTTALSEIVTGEQLDALELGSAVYEPVAGIWGVDFVCTYIDMVRARISITLPPKSDLRVVDGPPSDLDEKTQHYFCMYSAYSHGTLEISGSGQTLLDDHPMPVVAGLMVEEWRNSPESVVEVSSEIPLQDSSGFDSLRISIFVGVDGPMDQSYLYFVPPYDESHATDSDAGTPTPELPTCFLYNWAKQP